MPVAPISSIAPLILLFLAAQAARRRQNPLVVALLGFSAAHCAILILASDYHVSSFQQATPISASIIPPLAFAAFHASVFGIGPGRASFSIIHLSAPVGTAITLGVIPELLDVLLPAFFVGYACAILAALRESADGLPNVKLETGERAKRLWSAVAILLICSGLLDVFSDFVPQAGGSDLRLLIKGAAQSLILVAIGFIVAEASEASDADPEAAATPPRLSPIYPETAGELMRRLDAAMREQELYLDPDLTAKRLARRIGAPADQMTIAIRRLTGDSVSGYVNAYRVERAARRIGAGESAPQAMRSAGFSSRQDFIREFRRLKDCAPGDWRRRIREEVQA